MASGPDLPAVKRALPLVAVLLGLLWCGGVVFLMQDRPGERGSTLAEGQHTLTTTGPVRVRWRGKVQLSRASVWAGGDNYNLELWSDGGGGHLGCLSPQPFAAKRYRVVEEWRSRADSQAAVICFFVETINASPLFQADSGYLSIAPGPERWSAELQLHLTSPPDLLRNAQDTARIIASSQFEFPVPAVPR